MARAAVQGCDVSVLSLQVECDELYSRLGCVSMVRCAR